MMTPQEVAGCTFSKAMMGGYNMVAVDDFLDKLTEDYTTLYNENAALKSKLKVVADKLKEYRDMEETMRAALLTSQKMANSIVAEAEQRRDALIADAAAAAMRRLNEIRGELEQEEQRLKDTRAEVDRQLEAESKRLAAGQEQLRAFIRDVSAVCNGQLALLDKLPELPVAVEQPLPPVPDPAPVAAAPVPPAPVEEIPPVFDGAPVEESASVDFPPEAEEDEPQEQEEQPKPVQAPIPMGDRDIAKELDGVFSSLDASGGLGTDPFASDEDDEDEEDSAATRVVNLDDLQFGRNYNKK